jgi:malonate transporter
VLRTVMKKALIIGIMLGFLFNFSGLSLPQAVADTLNLIVRAALPVALFGMGGVLFKYRPSGDMRAIAFVCGVSLLLHPSIVWLLGTLNDLSIPAFRSAVLSAAMPSGINGYIFANMYGRARRVAASAVLLGTAFSIATIGVWLLVLP